MASNFNKLQVFSRSGALLTTVSAMALLMSSPLVYARGLNGGGGGGAVTAPNVASDAAAQAAAQAAAAARQTQDSLARAARAVQDIQAVQAAARAAAAAAQTSVTAPISVPNGLGAGGLLPNMPAGWSGAAAPTQGVDAAGQTQVNIRQLTQQAILNWQSFNVGARTTLTFDQGGNSNWVALNRVTNATAPSQILGNIKADGHVYVINQSGIIFGGNSQVNVGSLIASTAGISDAQFKDIGIYSTQSGGNFTPSFTAAGGKVVVEAGATISTNASKVATSGGGYVLMIGSQVENAGEIMTPKGQTILAAGDDFILRRGLGTDANTSSTTRGHEILPVIAANSANGLVRNSGLIQASQGDITLAGRTLLQDGALIASSSVHTRGTIHLLNSASDSKGSITLGANSFTAVIPDLDGKETALDSQRQSLIDASVETNKKRLLDIAGFDNLSALADRQDQSRIEIVSGGTVTFKGGSQTAAQGGQIAVSSTKQIVAEDGALLDVSGLRKVALAMDGNNIKVNLQGSELRDSPQNRDSDALKSNDVWIDLRTLTLMPDGTGGYVGDRYYTNGGLLEVGGHLGNTKHGIGEWVALGGTITLSAPEVIAQRGATFDISGGSIDYAAGWIYSTNLIGSDGRRYSVDNAPADLRFRGFAGGFVRTHNIQGQESESLTEIWTTLFDRGRTSKRWEEGYTVGRDAGRLILSTPTASFEASIIADTVTGERQTTKRSAATNDGYKLTQTTAAQNGTLALGRYDANGRLDLYNSDVRITDKAGGGANTVWFDAKLLSEQNLGGLDLGTRGKITIDADVTFAAGADIRLIAPVIAIDAAITAQSGSFSTTNVFQSGATGSAAQFLALGGRSEVMLASGAVIDLRGAWVNKLLDKDVQGEAFINGGTVSLVSSGDVKVERDSVIDVSSGGALSRTAKLTGGKGGNVALKADANTTTRTGRMLLDGEIRGYGVAGGGKLDIETGGKIVIGAMAEAGALRLDPSLFQTGFANYNINGHRGLTVTAGTQLDVIMPVYMLGTDATSVPTGADAPLTLALPPLTLENAMKGTLTQRKGASLALRAGVEIPQIGEAALTPLVIENGAVITVDPGQKIALAGIGQITVDGRLNAWGGEIAIDHVHPQEYYDPNITDRSIWIGDNAVIDVAARAVTAVDARGRRYGMVGHGGTIAIGGQADFETNSVDGAADSIVVIRAGALLDASGAQAVIDLSDSGIGKSSSPLTVASNGGTITLQSAVGMVLDGRFRAAAGGAGAAGGSLKLALPNVLYAKDTADAVLLAPHEIAIVTTQGGRTISDQMRPGDAGLAYGKARLGVDQITRGGFDTLVLLSGSHTATGGLISFADGVDLKLAQSLRLYGNIGLADGAPTNARVALSAAHVLLGAGQIAGEFLGTNPDVPGVAGSTSRAFDGAHLGITADLIDIRLGNFAGLQGTLQKATGKVFNRGGFRDVALTSRGDIRMLEEPSLSGTTLRSRLSAPGDLTVTAAQIYPATGVPARIEAAGTLNIARTPGTDPAVPFSVFGSLELQGSVVNQGGVVRAPLGLIKVGLDAVSGGTFKGSQTNLLTGSITSVSAAGLVLPYGGTIDGLTYKFNGTDITPVDPFGTDNRGAAIRGVSLRGLSVDVDQGAVIDLSGGGRLVGAGFFSGRGGSVDILTTPLANANPAFGFSSAGNAVYAIVPGFTGAAPIADKSAAGTPAIGQQVTVPAGVPGLPAGTYTLLPSNYALLPGAFRVEVGQSVTASRAPVSTEIGTYVANGHLGIAHTGIRSALPNQLLITPGDKVRTHSAYNEMDYNSFVMADAVRRGFSRGMITSDAKLLELALSPGAGMSGKPALVFDGKALFAAEADSQGYAGTLSVRPQLSADLEILAAGQAPVKGATGVALYADQLNAFGAARMTIGGGAVSAEGYGKSIVSFGLDNARSVTVRSGAVLSAAEIFLVASQNAGQQGGSITIEQGATMTTLGRGAVPFDSSNGFVYIPNGQSVFAVSNGWVNLLAPGVSNTTSPVAIDVGGCVAGAICIGQTAIYSEGTIGAATDAAFTLRDNLLYGTRNLVFGISAVNLGSAEALAAAGAAGQLPPGMALNQTVLANLLRGNTSVGAPVLETLVLNARESVNIYGSVDLNTLNPETGKSSLARLVIGVPAIYGYGAASDKATITTGEFIWSGAVAPSNTGGSGFVPGNPIAYLPGAPVLSRLGDGTLDIVADRILLGYAPNTRPNPLVSADRLALGFSSVNFTASERVSSSGKGSLSVYHTQGSYQAETGFAFSGGNLTIRTAMVTGEAGSTNTITAGGTVLIAGNGGSAKATSDALGAELKISGQRITVDTAMVLPSGRLTLDAVNDLVLTDGARIDMAGREIALFDVKKYSWGGDLVLTSSGGNITMGAGASIDLSARYNRAGTLQVTALDAAAGYVSLAGNIRGGTTGVHDAGGTYVPYEAADISVRAQTLADFAGLNMRLNVGEAFGARRFQIKQGSLTIGDEVKARQVEIALDGGSLTVDGRIDASGFSVGSIRLAAMNDLIINGTLDAHGTGLRVDGYGKIIDSPNRAIIDVTSRTGNMILGGNAAFDLRSGTGVAVGSGAGQNDGVARGTLTLNARRLGGTGGQGGVDSAGNGANDVAVYLNGVPAISGARTIAVNAFRVYDDAPLAANPDVTGHKPQEITQGYLDGIDLQSDAFINAALANGALSSRLAGLGNYTLRPGVEIVSNAITNPNGDLTVVGDIDLSGYRYGPDANRIDANLRGFGISGALVFRAAGNLNIHGSINDGFAPPPVSPDDAKGWQLIEGRNTLGNGMTPFGGDIVVPIGNVKLEAGTTFPAGATLNYDIPVSAVTLPAGTTLPAQVTLTGSLMLPAGTVLGAEVTTANGTVYAAGTVLPSAMTLTAGSKLGAGFALRSAAAVQGFDWPKGVKIPVALVTRAQITLAQGSLIPSMTKMVLLGGQPVDLRPNGSGRNWALAPMLGEGSTSWDLALTAGADVGSADIRARNAKGKGDVVLADTHHGINSTSKTTTTTVFIGDRVLSLAFANEVFEDPLMAGKPAAEIAAMFSMTEDAFCETFPGACVSAPRTVSLAGATALENPSWAGRPAAEIAAMFFVTEAEFCSWGAYCEGGGREETTTTTTYDYRFGTPGYSVIRTGTGDLTVVAGRDVRMMSMFGVYTAGTNSSLAGGAAANAPYNLARGKTGDYVLGQVQADGKYDAALAAYRAWYPDHGGNVLIDAGRDVIGDTWGADAWSGTPSLNDPATQPAAGTSSSAISNWLWRQGSGGTAGVGDIATSWWINFGTYYTDMDTLARSPRLVGFTGIGALGGGDVTVRAGRDAGVIDARGDTVARTVSYHASRSQALNVAIGSTGRVVNGELVLTGGGDLTLRTGGMLNPNLQATMAVPGEGPDGKNQMLDLNGTITNLRGALNLSTSRIGGIDLAVVTSYGRSQSTGGILPVDPFLATGGNVLGGIVLMLGDSVANIDTRGNLILGGAGDPGRVHLLNTSAFSHNGTSYGSGGSSWFSLWTDHTAVNLFSAGGDLVPTLVPNEDQRKLSANVGTEPADGDAYLVMPSILRAIAANGNINFGNGIVSSNVLMLAPSRNGQLEMLAGKSIFAGGYKLAMSGADTELPNPFHAAFRGASGSVLVDNMSSDGTIFSYSGGLKPPLFTFGPNTPLAGGLHAGNGEPARVYAGDDIVSLTFGSTRKMTIMVNGRPRTVDTWYEAATPVWMRAGRDILAPNVLAMHNNLTDFSLIEAGHDVVYANAQVAGPGTLMISAGRNIRQDDKGYVVSLGSVIPGDKTPGANIFMQAGIGNTPPDYAKFAALYLDPANRAVTGTALADQPGKAMQTAEALGSIRDLAGWLKARFDYKGTEAEALAYFNKELTPDQRATFTTNPLLYAWLQSQGYGGDQGNALAFYLEQNAAGKLTFTYSGMLLGWMKVTHGFRGDETSARSAFDALPAEQQAIFLRQVYFAELKTSGREFTNQDGPRHKSYLRGNNAIAALLPETDASGHPIKRSGDIVMFGGSGVRTFGGGDIELLTPAGQTIIGVEGQLVPAEAGLVTQKAGNISIYAKGSIPLGLSRQMTTFGGNILNWSATGDINAGRGAKTTVIYTPPKRSMDKYGNVELAPPDASSGAGYQTQAPLPEVPPGDVDLVAPLGTIDAGEAGISVSGNVNLAALQVLNAANIQVQGASAGIPVVQAPSISAALSTSNATAATQQTATPTQTANAQPSVIIVEVLGYGGGSGDDEQKREQLRTEPRDERRTQNPNSPVQVLGAGTLEQAAMDQLTAEERRRLVR